MRAREKRLNLNILEKRLKQAEIRLGENPSEENMENWQATKSNLENLYEDKIKSYILRSKAQWYEEGEKNTKYFMSLEKRNKSKSSIRQLCLENGDITCNPKIIQNELNNFYKKLYSSRTENVDQRQAELFLQSAELIKLQGEDKASCEGPITLQEIRKVIPLFKHDKTPGNDGIPIEFYIVFFNLIGKLLVDSLNESFEIGELSTSQKQGVITLIEKKDQDKRQIKNWRPISLINVDAKICSKIIAKRIENVLPNIIHYSQTAYVKDRSIWEGLRLIDDILLFTKENNIPGILLTIDFEKAFDSVEWNFLFRVLESLNFGDTLIRWIKTLYKNSSSCVMNRGLSTGYFPLGRGVRQGDPLSPYLFIICLEVLLNHIRLSKDIKGLSIEQTQIKLSAFADDLTLFLDSEHSAYEVFSLIKTFSGFSGLKVNKAKCEALWLGSNKDREDFPLDIRWPKAIKILGIVFSYNTNEMFRQNFTKNLNSMRDLSNIWAQRSLSILGKISIIKCFLIAKMNFVCTAIHTPASVIKEVNSIIFKFLWNGMDKVKRKATIGTYEEGGLKMIDFESFVRTKHIMWIKRLLYGPAHDWKIIPNAFF